MKRIRYLFVFNIFCLGIVFQLNGQTRIIDSLRIAISNQTNPIQKQQLALKICEQYYSLSADSLQHYVKIGQSYSNNQSPEFLRFQYFYSYYFLKMGKPEEACIYIDSLLQHTKFSNEVQNIYREFLFVQTASQIRNSQYKLAMETALQLLKSAEQNKDTLAVIRAYSLLGWANMELESEREAIIWLNKGIQYTNNPQLLTIANSLFLNIASCYNLIDQPDSAKKYVALGLQYSIDAQNLTSQANGLNIRAAIFSKANSIKEAQKDLEDGLLIREQIGDLHYIISDMGQLAHFYAFINQPQKGIAIALKGIQLAQEAKNAYKVIYLKKGLYKNYQAANRLQDAIDVLVDVIRLKDSLYEANSENDIAELSTKYELQKKENIIIQQENKIIRSRYFTIGTSIALILASIIIWLIYRNYNHIQQRKMEQALAEEKINSFKAVKLAEEKERKRIAADLHDNLGSYAAAITSNIRYLKESSTLEKESIISQLDENAQGIVTQLGDSIWVLKNEQLPITKLADRFKAWAQRIIQNYPKVRYNFNEEIERDIEFTPATILNLFLILKECFNNSLKHSDCTEINITFKSTDEFLIQLEDNGKGFQSNIINRGNGIENIKHRAKECGLHVKWETRLPSGTSVTLKSTTTN